MNRERIRESIIAIGAFGLLAAVVHIWQRQFDADLPTSEPARRIDSPAPGDAALPQASTRTTPAQNPGAWLSDADYPLEAVRNGWTGTTGFRLEIDETGAVERCVVTQSAGYPVLDEATCSKLKQNARFLPARDASGMAVRDSYKGRLTWRIPS